jgi:hypothetical protein
MFHHTDCPNLKYSTWWFNHTHSNSVLPGTGIHWLPGIFTRPDLPDWPGTIPTSDPSNAQLFFFPLFEPVPCLFDRLGAFGTGRTQLFIGRVQSHWHQWHDSGELLVSMFDCRICI